MKKFFQRFYMVIIFVFLYAPILTLVVLSFNSSKFMSSWTGFSLKWYRQMFASEMIMTALQNTLVIALLSALIATVLGTLACIGLNHMKKLPRSLFMGLNNVPMLNADIVTGISLMLVFLACGITLGFPTILIGHITFNVPYVVLSVMPKMKGLENSTYEAALDLGASPARAFFSVIFPEILPGVLSGFLLAFTMSLDDFVVTHFVRGAGINTLSTLIYSEVRKGVRPSLYALSAIIFTIVFLTLLLVNLPESEKEKRAVKNGRRIRPARLAAGCILAASLLVLTGSFIVTNANVSKRDNGELKVYNWGEYIDEETIAIFEAETGIHVVYDTFETNEELYPIIEAGGVHYDVICPSDYMIEKMIQNNLLQEIELLGMDNLDYIDEEIWEKCRAFDPENVYAVPYTYGILGILYNEDLVEEVPDTWTALWDPRYAGEILAYNSVRDLYTAPLAYLGYSLNTTDPKELAEATAILQNQKQYLQKYVIDQIKDSMASNSATLAMSYSGEYLALHEVNEALQFVVPKEGSNFYIDAWVIPKNAENPEAARLWIDFLNRPDIALKNFEYVTYSIPNLGAIELMDDEVRNDPAIFFDKETIENCEVFHYLGEEGDALYNEEWLKVK